MARQSDTSSYTTMSDSHSTESHHPTREEPVVDAATSSHARRPKETVTGFSSEIALDEHTREGSRYVHNSIATIVTQILSGNRDVPGVSVPLNTIIPDIAACQEKAVVLSKNVTDNVEQPNAHEGSKVEKPSGKVRSEKAKVTQNVEDKSRAETINVEELSDNDLLATVVPRIAKRVRTRREKKAVELKSPSKEVGAPNPHKQPESESTHKRKSYGPTKAWSKEVPKKVKTKAVVAESESDAPCDVTTSMSRKKPTSSRLALERELAQNAMDCKEIVDLIKEAGLMRTVSQLPKCYETLVKEFIVNLSEECADGTSKEFRKVYVRGKCVTFSPSVINQYLGRADEEQPELEVTDNTICQVITAKQVRKWPLKGKLVASQLSVKYAMLHKVGSAYWVPTNHKSNVSMALGKFIYAVGTKAKMDYGAYIFDQTMKHAGSFSVKGPIAFPSLICGVVLNQFPNILTENDFVRRRESPLAFSYKLFLGKHVPDIVVTSGETSKTSHQPDKADVIAVLKETCKELGARKNALEQLILQLESTAEDTDGAEGQMAEGEEEASSEKEADEEADDEAED
ncbi:uncharacterized protein LOC127122714 [Lathyrus oleraceus]|uniref:uncharacterized protein LOC127122714 n=1 Tax=Pisum sativum TaxID=3888 RepID=UPI0021CF0823|nr:uncharacterized protein LOC127122714 [Pisum sativum]